MPRFDIARRTETDQRSETSENSTIETNETETCPGNDVASDHTACSQKEPETIPKTRGPFWLHDDRTRIKSRGKRRLFLTFNWLERSVWTSSGNMMKNL